MILTIDFETRSTVDIGKHGAYRYAADPTTEITCLGVAVDECKPVLWVPDKFYNLVRADRLLFSRITTSQLKTMIAQADTIVAQNSMFEYLIWNIIMVRQHGFDPIPQDKLHDTQAQLAYHALPLNLEQASLALNLTHKKDMVGHAVMLKLCKPRQPRKAERESDPDWATNLYWWEDGEDYEALFNYCGRDVEAERLIYNMLAKLPQFERDIFLLDQKINLAGVQVDVDSVQAVVDRVKDRERKMLLEFQKHTGGEVSGPRSYVALKDWVNKEAGLNLVSIDKETTKELLGG